MYSVPAFLFTWSAHAACALRPAVINKIKKNRTARKRLVVLYCVFIFATPEYMISEMTVTNDRYDTIPVYYTYCAYILL